MKRKIRKIWGVGLVLVLLVMLLVPAAPASAGTLSFTEDTTIPSATNKIIVAGNIVDLAVASGGERMYAASGSGLYKSSDAGETWSTVTMPDALALTSVNLVAVAPDDEDRLVALGDADNLVIYVSTDAGSNWSSLGTIKDSGPANPATAIYDVAISPLSGGVRYIACAGTFDISGTGENDKPGLFYFDLGATAPAWKDAVNCNVADFDEALDGNVILNILLNEVDNFRAVAFSPNFASDMVMLAVSETIGVAAAIPGAAQLHIASFNQKAWDGQIFTGYPKAFESSTVTDFDVNKADITLDPEYLGGDDTTRIAFIGASITDSVSGEVGGIYRFKDVTLEDMIEIGIYSVAWDGTNLVAGPSDSNEVKRCADALASSPTVSTARANKRPGGDSNVTVAWSGENVVAATSGISSAFARSTDNGLSFNDLSLVDHVFTVIEDVYVSPDGSTTYLLVSDGASTALWRKASTWERIFWVNDIEGYIVRACDDDPDVVYIADVGAATRMYYSTNGGEDKWFTRASRYKIGDLAIESADVAYVAVNTKATVSKTTNGGFTWDTAKSTLLVGGSIHTISTLGEDLLIVGGTTGYVSYSADGNSSWTKISKQLSVPDTTQVTASGLATDDYIYAATSGNDTLVQRWQIGTSTTWSNLSAPTDAASKNFGATGIALVDSILYVLMEEGGSAYSRVVRTLGPTAASVTWSSMDSDGESFNVAPSALRVSSGKLWAIETSAANTLWSYSDTLATTAPALVAPADGFQNPMNPVRGRAVDMNFQWEKPSSYVTEYDIAIYTDEACTVRVARHAVESTGTTVVCLIGPYQAAGTAQFEFAPGTTYYWKVQVSPRAQTTALNGPVYSPWSEVRSFTVEPGVALVPTTLSPANGKLDASPTPSFSWDPVSGAAKYKFQLSASVAMTTPLVDVEINTTGYSYGKELDFGTTYYWRVKAIEPVEGGWSTVSNFTIMTEAVAPPPPVVVKEVPAPVINIPPAPAPPPDIVIPSAPAPPAPITPAFIWAIVVIGAVLVIAVIVLIIRTRRAV